MDQPGKVANPARGQLNRENNIPLSPCVPENLVSRDGFSRPVPRQPAHLHTQAQSGTMTSRCCCDLFLYSRPRTRYYLGLCSFGARRKSRFLVLGAAVFRSAEKKKPPKFFLRGRKSYLAAEHHSEATPEKNKNKKKTRFFRLGAEKYDLRAPKEQRPTVFRSAEKKKTPKNFGGGRKILLGDRKSYLAAEHHNEAALKKNKRGFSAWAPKNTTLGRLRSKGLVLPDWQPRILLGMVEARSVNVKNTHSHTHRSSLISKYLVANPARGQLNRIFFFFPIPVRA